jgi:hypothetical protein
MTLADETCVANAPFARSRRLVRELEMYPTARYSDPSPSLRFYAAESRQAVTPLGTPIDTSETNSRPGLPGRGVQRRIPGRSADDRTGIHAAGRTERFTPGRRCSSLWPSSLSPLRTPCQSRRGRRGAAIAARPVAPPWWFTGSTQSTIPCRKCRSGFPASARASPAKRAICGLRPPGVPT